MQTLKIQIPDGFVIDGFDKASGEVRFKEKPKDVTERIKSIEDAIRELGESDEDVITLRTLLDVIDPCGHLVNYQSAIVIAKALNEGWKPNWNNSDEYKYVIWFEMGSSGFRFYVCDFWVTSSDVGSRLCFKSSKLANYAGAQFTHFFKEFMTFK